MPNIPFNKEKMKTLKKGLNLTREVIGMDNEGNLHLYPNRKMRRNGSRPWSPNNRKQTKGRLFISQLIKLFKDVKDKVIEFSQELLDLKLIKFAGYRSIFHKKINV